MFEFESYKCLKKYAAGFFVEGFGMLNSTNLYPIFYESSETYGDKITDFALGLGIGGKWVTKSGFVAELNLGVGRNLFKANEFEDNEIVAKAGISLGYRF